DDGGELLLGDLPPERGGGRGAGRGGGARGAGGAEDDPAEQLAQSVRDGGRVGVAQRDQLDLDVGAGGDLRLDVADDVDHGLDVGGGVATDDDGAQLRQRLDVHRPARGDDGFAHPAATPFGGGHARGGLLPGPF